MEIEVCDRQPEQVSRSVSITDDEWLILTQQPEQVSRSVTLTNDEWLILTQCVEAFSGTYRAQHSQTIATYLTRGQVDHALLEADRMDSLLKRLDHIQVKLVS